MPKTKTKPRKIDIPTKIIPLEKLHADPANARLHDERNIAVIKASLQEFKQYHSLIVQKSSMKILIGNGTYSAMKELGWTEAECRVLDIDNVTAARLAIIDNRSAELATWDNKVLQETLEAMQLEEIDLESVGFTVEEMENLWVDMGEIDSEFANSAEDIKLDEIEYSEEKDAKSKITVTFFECDESEVIKGLDSIAIKVEGFAYYKSK